MLSCHHWQSFSFYIAGAHWLHWLSYTEIKHFILALPFLLVSLPSLSTLTLYPHSLPSLSTLTLSFFLYRIIYLKAFPPITLTIGKLSKKRFQFGQGVLEKSLRKSLRVPENNGCPWELLSKFLLGTPSRTSQEPLTEPKTLVTSKLESITICLTRFQLHHFTPLIIWAVTWR